MPNWRSFPKSYNVGGRICNYSGGRLMKKIKLKKSIYIGDFIIASTILFLICCYMYIYDNKSMHAYFLFDPKNKQEIKSTLYFTYIRAVLIPLLIYIFLRIKIFHYIKCKHLSSSLNFQYLLSIISITIFPTVCFISVFFSQEKTEDKFSALDFFSFFLYPLLIFYFIYFILLSICILIFLYSLIVLVNKLVKVKQINFFDKFCIVINMLNIVDIIFIDFIYLLKV